MADVKQRSEDQYLDFYMASEYWYKNTTAECGGAVRNVLTPGFDYSSIKPEETRLNFSILAG